MLVIPWRGRWDPDSPRFAPEFCLLTVGALLSSYHSHLHGAALLAVPLAAAFAAPRFSLLTRTLVAAAMYVPSVWLLWDALVVKRLAVLSASDSPLWYVWPGEMPAVLFALAFALMSFELLGEFLPVGMLLVATARSD